MKNVKKMLVLLLSFCLIFCFCSCENNTVDDDDVDKELSSDDEQLIYEIMTAPIEAGAGGGVAGEFAYLVDDTLYSWDEYLEYIKADGFINTGAQQRFWKLKAKFDGLVDYNSVQEIRILDDCFSLAFEESASYPIRCIGLNYYGSRGYGLDDPLLDGYPMHTALTEEIVKSLGWSYAKATLNGREYRFSVKDGTVQNVEFLLDESYEMLVGFSANYAPGIENMSVSLGDMKIAAPVTVDEKVAFATAFADTVISELTVVTPPPAVTE